MTYTNSSIDIKQPAFVEGRTGSKAMGMVPIQHFRPDARSHTTVMSEGFHTALCGVAWLREADTLSGLVSGICKAVLRGYGA